MTETSAIQQTITLLEQEIEALEQRRGELLRVIDSLRPMVSAPTPTRSRATTKTGKRSKSVTPISSDATAHSDAIVAVLRAKGPRSPAQLAKALKLARPVLTAQIKPLLKSGAVVATGATVNRQFSLPSRSGEKEAP